MSAPKGRNKLGAVDGFVIGILIVAAVLQALLRDWAELFDAAITALFAIGYYVARSRATFLEQRWPR